MEELSAEDAIKVFSKPPVRTTRPKQQPAGIETLPLKDKQLRMQAIQKTLDARNQQALEKLRSKMKSGEIKKGAAPKTNLTKVRKRIIMDRQNLLNLAKNEQIPVKNIEDFLSGKTDKVLRPSGRGIIQRDKEGNPFITETYSSKYDPLRKNKLFDDEPEFKDGGPVDKKDEDTVPLDPNEFDEMFRKMFSEWEWEKKKDSWKDKDYADGGLATLFEERG